MTPHLHFDLKDVKESIYVRRSVDVIRSYFTTRDNSNSTQLYEQLLAIKSEAGDHSDVWFDENFKSGTSNEVDFLALKDSAWHRKHQLKNENHDLQEFNSFFTISRKDISFSKIHFV